MCLIETHVPTSTLGEYVSFHVLFKNSSDHCSKPTGIFIDLYLLSQQ